ncbi:uncharacterized protein V1516DRAFT_116717 [Lipomyces oligophaga]|uniref:uncharacterized protein n=1 Tax=Lipomyces oligophaga TaxID=45792 RepID=UPI0034CE0F69
MSNSSKTKDGPQKLSPPATDTPLQPSHRRTRSGCYTCRKRRVKCDETRPICNRCKKGQRECLFPAPRSTLSKRQRALEARRLRQSDSLAKQHSPTGKDVHTHSPILSSSLISTNLDDDTIILNTSLTHESPLPTLFDPQFSSSEAVQSSTRTSTDVSSPRSSTQASPINASGVLSKSESLSSMDVPALLAYHRRAICHRHYFLSLDPCGFFDYLLDVSATCEPLMYALATFSAYHYALRHRDPDIEVVFENYDKAVKTLQRGLNQAPDLRILSAILILACLEMYLGDVKNEIVHEDAAFHLVQSNYTMDNFFKDQYHSFLFGWLRYTDIRRSIASGASMVLQDPWHDSHHSNVRQKAVQFYGSDSSPTIHLHKIHASIGLLWAKVCTIAEGRRSGKYTPKRLEDERRELLEQGKIVFNNFGEKFFEEVEIRTPTDDIVCPLVFKEHDVGLSLILYYGWKIFFASHSTLATTGHPLDPADPSEVASLCARIVAGFYATEQEYPGCLFVAHSYLCMAILYMPSRLYEWTCRILAHIRSEGYFFPEQVRHQMAMRWKRPELLGDWLDGPEPISGPDGYNNSGGVLSVWQKLFSVNAEEIDNDDNSHRVNLIESLREMRGIFEQA